ncbi:MAG: flagellar protein FlgN [Rhodocyclaceae bacterium]|nr:flagellar protein FlgN [Rhodocyclaceae bacterium]
MSAEALAQTLDDEVRLVAALIDALERERKVLLDGKAEALSPLVAEKEALILRWRELAQARDRALARQGLPGGKPGMHAWLAQAPEALQRQWRQVLGAIERAQELNRLNGELIALQLAHHRNALASLTQAQNVGLLYGPDGEASAHGPGSRRLGEA